MINKQKIVWMLIFSVGFYIVYSIWGNAAKIKDTLFSIPFEKYVLFVSFILVGYVLRYIRWHYLLHVKEVKVPHKISTKIFLSGMSMAISPGKIGEFLKTYYLNRDCSVEYSKSYPVVLMERVTDVLAITLLMSCGLLIIPMGVQLFSTVMILLIMIFVTLKSNKLMDYFLSLIGRKLKVQTLNKIKETHRHLLDLLTFKVIGISTLLGLVAWFCECFVLFFIFSELHIDISLIESLVIFSSGTLLGAISMIPGGIGISEGSMTSMMLLLGVNTSSAVAITILIRLLTLWFGTFLGFIVLLLHRKK